jgi:hypothetical protein
MGRELLCTAGRFITVNYGVIVEGVLGENFCVPQVDYSVTIMW